MIEDSRLDNPNPVGRMRGAVLAEPGRFEISEAPLPVVGRGNVLVRLEGCGVCASNIPPFEGREWFDYPMAIGALGHEGWGRVEAIGEDVSTLSVGDRVAILSQHAYAEYDAVPERLAVRLPERLAGLPFPGEPLGCAVNIFERSSIRAGDNVVIVGVGFLGALLIQLAVKHGAHVIALARKPYALQVAEQMGAAHTLLMDDHWQIIEGVRELTDGKFADVTIECTGKEWPLNLAGELTGVRRRLVIAGFHQDGLRSVNVQLWNWRGLDVINAHERDEEVYMSGIDEAARLVDAGMLDPFPLLTHRYALSGIGRAMQDTKDRPSGFMKALITFEGTP